MRLFLDEIYDRRIKVLSYINGSRKAVTITEIAEATGLAKRTVSIFVKQFEQELDLSKGIFKVHYAGQIIKYVSASNIDLNSIGSEFLLQSTIYKIVRHVFLYDGIDVKKFCETEFISAATFSRYRKKLKDILHTCGLNLSRENKIVGEELRIRNFLFLFFTNASNFWLFNQQEYKEMSTYFAKHLDEWEELNSIKQLKFSLIIYISAVRSSQKHFFDNETLIKLAQKRIQEPRVKVLFDYFSLKKNKNSEQIWAEISGTQFFFYKEHIFNEPLELEGYEEYFSQENFSFVQHSKQFTCKILSQFFNEFTDLNLYLSIRKEIDLLHLIINTCFIDRNIFYYIYDKENFFYADQLETDIKEKVKKIINELRVTEYNEYYRKIPDYIDQDSFQDYAYLIVYTLLTRFQKVEFPPVRVFVQNTKIFASDLLEEKINLLFGNRVTSVDTTMSNADIIVTDTSVLDAKADFEQTYVATFSDFSDFSSLVEVIQDKLLEKYDQRIMYYQKASDKELSKI
ncbi:helix-turn-helix domain-containing protein [Enterococcus crotali]